MIPPHFIGRLEDAISTQLKEYARQLAQGMAEDWPDYKFRAGQIAGLKRVNDIIKEITEDDEKR